MVCYCTQYSAGNGPAHTTHKGLHTMAKVPAKPNGALPKGTRYSGSNSPLEVAAHVNRYVGKLDHTAQATFWGLPASQQAASAGCLQYSQQYAWRQHLRKPGTRANGHWGQPYSAGKAPASVAANAQALKLEQAAQAGARQAKQAAQAAPAREGTAQAS